jgi:phosphonoacetaldehyde hydrolase
VGIEAGRHAGALTVAIARTGNALGLSVADLEALPTDELNRRLQPIREDFYAAGAHHVLDSVADLRSLVS